MGATEAGARGAARRTVVAGILARTRRIAVVGASDDPWRPSHGVFGRLLAAGYDVIPVNPNVRVVHGVEAVDRLADVEGPIDIVDVFRRIQVVPAVAREAVDVGAAALWLQSGLRSAAAREIAETAGIVYVEDVCLAVEVAVGGHGPREPRR